MTRWIKAMGGGRGIVAVASISAMRQRLLRSSRPPSSSKGPGENEGLDAGSHPWGEPDLEVCIPTAPSAV